VKRRIEPATSPTPLEITDYRAWCAGQGLRPFGHSADPESMRAAVSNWKAWGQFRTEWALAHGVDEGDLETVGRSAPFDIDLI
jgi:hypothetical protein